MNKKHIKNCKQLLNAYKTGELGQTTMPEDTHPKFNSIEERLSYFTLPMSLNYQRNSYILWENALLTFNDTKTKKIFDINSNLKENELRKYLLKYKLALQPNKHINTWNIISKTVLTEFKSFESLFKESDYDFLKLKQIIQIDYKKGFPYLSGPKIFNYWSHIIQVYGKLKLSNSEFIEIAPDTHITKCSIKLGLITQKESEKISKEKLNLIWRNALKDSNITPIEMHSPLWFWSRNNFLFKLE
jgi:hypothetical protein